MANNTLTPENTLELFEGYRSQSGSHARRGKCTVFSWRRVVCVLVVVILLVVMGILMAMFGPGSKDLKYHDREDCKGKPRASSLNFATRKVDLVGLYYRTA